MFVNRLLTTFGFIDCRLLEPTPRYATRISVLQQTTNIWSQPSQK
jgi:hypothetical protein